MLKLRLITGDPLITGATHSLTARVAAHGDQISGVLAHAKIKVGLLGLWAHMVVIFLVTKYIIKILILGNCHKSHIGFFTYGVKTITHKKTIRSF